MYRIAALLSGNNSGLLSRPTQKKLPTDRLVSTYIVKNNRNLTFSR